MINLLPPDTKMSYRYARRNVILRRWVLVFLITFVGLGGIVSYGALTIHESTVRYTKQIETAEIAFKKEDSASVDKQVQEVSNSFKLVIKVLSNAVLFSQLLKQIAETTPKNTNLTGLSINQVQGGLDITAVATDYNSATQVQVNLADPSNKIFSKADIVSINCQSTSASDPRYPCTVTIRALFAADNPFLFINSKATP